MLQASLSRAVSLQITQHPENQSKIYGDKVKLMVSAKGPDLLKYQWWKDGKVVTTEDYPNCTGINSSMLEINPFLPEYVGSYKCVVGHESMDKEVESRSAQLNLGMFHDTVHIVYKIYVRF